MKKVLLLKTILLLIFINNKSFGQTKVIYPNKAFWSKSEATQIFDNKWGFGVDYIFRSNNELNQGSIFKNWHRHSIRPWVHYQLDRNIRVSFSPISYFRTQEYFAKPEDFSRKPTLELRTNFQIVHQHYSLSGKFNHTFGHLLEIRYRNPFDKDNFFTFTRYRMLYRLRYLINKDYYNEKNVLYTYVSNEVMVNYGRNVVYNMFSQNRIQLALGYRVHLSTRLEVRYVNRLRSRPTGFEYDNSQIVMLGLFVDQISSLVGKEVRPVKYYD